MSHTASTTVSRYFEKTRGKALSVTWLGLSAAEFILPILMVFFINNYKLAKYMDFYFYFSFNFFTTNFIFLINKLKLDSRENSIEDLVSENNNIKQWTRSEVLKDYRFYIISLNMLSLPSIATGVFVYQSFILTSKNWGPFIMAQSFMAYSVLSVITLSISGFLIDKYYKQKITYIYEYTLFISAIICTLFDSPYSSFIFLGLIGISNGLQMY